MRRPLLLPLAAGPAVALALVLAAIALLGTPAGAGLPLACDGHRNCPLGEMVVVGSSGQPQGHRPADPCSQEPACGGGGALSLGSPLSAALPVLAGIVLVLLSTRRVRRAVAAEPRSALLVSGLDHPPRPATA